MSLGARFIEVEGAADASGAGGYAVEQSADFMARQKAKIAESVAKADIIISTAQIPGKSADSHHGGNDQNHEERFRHHRPGGFHRGNTELTKNDLSVCVHGVTIIGHLRLPSTLPGMPVKCMEKIS